MNPPSSKQRAPGIPRRQFLKTGGVLAASTLAFPACVKLDTRTHDADRLNVAVIGCGGRGRFHLRQMRSERVVAVCDVDFDRAGGNLRAFSDVPRFADYRVMFDKMGKDIDAVVVCTPDHMHYPIALWALAHRKHVLVEKPLTRTFEEAMLLKEAAREAGVITQMGNQGRAADGLRVLQEWVEAGLIGEVTHAYHWTNRPVWPQGMTDFQPVQPVPEQLDWDLWQGVAPRRSYHPEIAPFKWRGYIDYGCGAVGDAGCHIMDAAYVPLKLGYPTRLRADSDGLTDIAFPNASTIEMEFPVPNRSTPLKVTWMDGGRLPTDVPFMPAGVPHDSGTILVGEQGAISCDMYNGSPRIYPDAYREQLQADGAFPERTLPRIRGGHVNEWLNGIRNGVQPGSSIVDFSADFTAMTLLGVSAMLADTPLKFNPETLKFEGNEAANAFLKSQYEYKSEFLPG